ncbi:MAG: hypothetical protein AAF235_06710 [Planctomycetota bacterium]
MTTLRPRPFCLHPLRASLAGAVVNVLAAAGCGTTRSNRRRRS